METTDKNKLRDQLYFACGGGRNIKTVREILDNGIDVRGQVVTDKQEKELKAKIVSKSEGIIKNDDIRLIRE